MPPAPWAWASAGRAPLGWAVTSRVGDRGPAACRCIQPPEASKHLHSVRHCTVTQPEAQLTGVRVVTHAAGPPGGRPGPGSVDSLNLEAALSDSESAAASEPEYGRGSLSESLSEFHIPGQRLAWLGLSPLRPSHLSGRYGVR